jgi:hypothetical protein
MGKRVSKGEIEKRKTQPEFYIEQGFSFYWYPHGDLNPSLQAENLTSWARLDDRGPTSLLCEKWMKLRMACHTKPPLAFPSKAKYGAERGIWSSARQWRATDRPNC